MIKEIKVWLLVNYAPYEGESWIKVFGNRHLAQNHLKKIDPKATPNLDYVGFDDHYESRYEYYYLKETTMYLDDKERK